MAKLIFLCICCGVGVAVAFVYLLKLLLEGMTVDQIATIISVLFLSSLIAFGSGFLLAYKLKNPQVITKSQFVLPQKDDTFQTTQTVELPTFYENGTLKPLGMGNILSIGGQSIDAKYLYRLCDCPTPARSEWIGKKEIYSDVTKIAESGGLIAKTGQGYRWLVTTDKARAWIQKTIDLP